MNDKLNKAIKIYTDMTGDPASNDDVMAAILEMPADWVESATAEEIAQRLADETFND